MPDLNPRPGATASSTSVGEAERRAELVHVLAGLTGRGLLTQTSGNVSVRVDADRILITPSSMDYALIGPDDLALVATDGTVLSAAHRPSSELPLHLAVYDARPDLDALVHTHSPLATTFAVLNQPIPAVHYMITPLQQTRVEVCEYAVFGSRRLADNVRTTFRAPARAALLANHGMVAGGRTLAEASTVAETVELLAGLYHRALSIGTPIVLTDEQLTEVSTQIEALTYGRRVS